jgi:glyoxylase I family protein
MSTIDVTGIDHVYLAVSDLTRSEPFYDRVLCEILGFRKSTFVLAGAPHVNYFNRHFGLVIRPAAAGLAPARGAPGLHHLCLRVDSAREVDAVARLLCDAGIEASPARGYPEYAPDYVATYFSDPDGIRLEVTNYREERRRRHDDWEATR